MTDDCKTHVEFADKRVSTCQLNKMLDITGKLAESIDAGKAAELDESLSTGAVSAEEYMDGVIALAGARGDERAAAIVRNFRGLKSDGDDGVAALRERGVEVNEAKYRLCELMSGK